MNADAALEENRSAFALLADERERRALILRGTAQSIFFMAWPPFATGLWRGRKGGGIEGQCAHGLFFEPLIHTNIR